MMYNLNKIVFFDQFKGFRKMTLCSMGYKKVPQGLAGDKKQFSSLQKLYFPKIVKKCKCTPYQSFADGNRANQSWVQFFSVLVKKFCTLFCLIFFQKLQSHSQIYVNGELVVSVLFYTKERGEKYNKMKCSCLSFIYLVDEFFLSFVDCATQGHEDAGSVQDFVLLFDVNYSSQKTGGVQEPLSSSRRQKTSPHTFFEL